MLIENQSTNTGENVLFTKQLLAERGLDPQSFILVQKPYMERRSFATFRKLWPEKRVIVTSPQVSLDEYLARYSNDVLSTDDVVSIMVGDLQRVKLYAEKGFRFRRRFRPMCGRRTKRWSRPATTRGSSARDTRRVAATRTTGWRCRHGGGRTI